jgi:hypothetical protein
MADRTIDILLNMQTKGSGQLNRDLKITQQALKDIETQANRTREKMQKLAGVGRQLAMTGGLIVAPFIVAMKILDIKILIYNLKSSILNR